MDKYNHDFQKMAIQIEWVRRSYYIFLYVHTYENM
jgi:hypothetical protein